MTPFNAFILGVFAGLVVFIVIWGVMDWWDRRKG